MPQIKFGLAPAGSAADLEEEDPAWATRVLRFDPEYKFALAEAMGVQWRQHRRAGAGSRGGRGAGAEAPGRGATQLCGA